MSEENSDANIAEFRNKLRDKSRSDELRDKSHKWHLLESLEDLDEVTWYTPNNLSNDDEKEISEIIQPITILDELCTDVINKFEYYVLIGGCICRYKADLYIKDDVLEGHKEGNIVRDCDSDKVVYWRLTGNWLKNESLLYSSVVKENASYFDEWVVAKACNKNEITAIVNDINQHVSILMAPDEISINFKSLPFYSGEVLLRIESGGCVVFIIWKPGTVTILDWTSSPLHEQNRKSLNEKFANDKKLIWEYLCFFCDFLSGTNDGKHVGPFNIIQGNDLKRTLEAFSEKADITNDKRDQAAIKIDGFIAKYGSFDNELKESNIIDSACKASIKNVLVWYDTALFAADFTVDEDGVVVMTDDNSILDGASKPETMWGEYQQKPWKELSYNPIHLYRWGHDEPVSSLKSHKDIEKHLCITASTQQDAQNITLLNCDIYFPPKGTDESLFLSGKLDRLNLTGCRVIGDANLSDMSVSGTVAIKQCFFSSDLYLQNTNQRSCDIEQTKICGAIHADNMTLYGRLFINESFIHGMLYIDYLRSHQVFFIDSHFGDVVARYIIVDQSASFESCFFGNHKTENQTVIDLYGINIDKNNLGFHSCTIWGSVDVCYGQIGTGLFIQGSNESNSKIFGTIDITNVSAPGGVFFRGLIVTGDIIGTSIETNVIHFYALRDASIVKGRVNFSQSIIKGDVIVIGVRIGSSLADDERNSLSLRRSDIAGNLKFYLSENDLKDLSKHITKIPTFTSATHGINLRKIKVGGEIDLSCIQCTQMNTNTNDKIGGLVDLSDANITHGLTIKNHKFEISCEPMAAIIGSLNATSVCIGGSVDISGLELIKSKQDDSSDRSVIIRNSVIDNHLYTYSDDECGVPPHFAVIPGKLDLFSTSIGNLHISYHSFQNSEDKNNGINLARSKIGTLTITKKQNSQPRPVELKFLEVNYWDFHDDKETNVNSKGLKINPNEESSNYLNFLEQDPNIHRHTYRSVENMLYNQGHTDSANAIHIGMHRRLLESELDDLLKPAFFMLEPFKLIGLGCRFSWGKITGFGTNSNPLIWMVLIWLSISMMIFSNPSNIGPSEEGLAATNYKVGMNAGHPSPSEWGASDGLWMALRYHIPVINLAARDEWEPSSIKSGVYLCPSFLREDMICTKPFPYLTAESYAFIVLTLHWLFVPVIIFILSRKLLRSREG